MVQPAMTSRERVLAAVKGLPVDRAPVFFWLNPHTTCRLIAEYQPASSRIANLLARTLWRRFKGQGEQEAGEWARALPLLFEEYGNGRYVLSLGADVSVQSPELTSPRAFLSSVRKRDGRLSASGPFGATLRLGGIYAYPVESAVADPRGLEQIQFPEIADRQFASAHKFRQDHPDVCMAIEVYSFQQVVCDYILGAESFMLGLYDFNDEIWAFMRRLADWVVDIIRCAARTGADVVCMADDYGCTGRPLISMKMWKELTYPHLKRFIDVAHESGVPFMLHSCGYQMPFLAHYVEAGLDVLQCFQPKAGNDFTSAYEQYGDRLVFATGIDTQQGEMTSPHELRQDILRNYRVGRTKRRHILGMTHMLQYTMPMANIHAIFDTVREIQAGLHD